MPSAGLIMPYELMIVNYDVCCSAYQSNEQSPRERTSDLPSIFRYKNIINITFRLQKAQVCPSGLG